MTYNESFYMGDPGLGVSEPITTLPDWMLNKASNLVTHPVTHPVNHPVNHPKHYTSHPSGIECIDVTEHYNFNVGNAIKYLWRAGLKQEEGLADSEKQLQDLSKAAWYVNREIKRLQNSVNE